MSSPNRTPEGELWAKAGKPSAPTAMDAANAVLINVRRFGSSLTELFVTLPPVSWNERQYYGRQAGVSGHGNKRNGRNQSLFCFWDLNLRLPFLSFLRFRFFRVLPSQ